MKELKNISILMISMDTGLLKASGAGDVVDRHKEYAKSLHRLDIIVFGKVSRDYNRISENCEVYGVGKNIFSFFKAKNRAKKLIDKYGYDLIDTQDPHLTGMLGMCLKKKFKIKLEIHFHGDFWQNKIWLKESWKNKIYSIFQNKVVKVADAIRVVNPKIKEKLVNDGIASDKIEVINTPVNEAEFVKEIDIADINKIINKYNNKKILFFVGRLVPAKNLSFLLEAIKILSKKRDDFVLLIAGQGEKQGRLENFINNNNLENIAFLVGPKTHQELPSYFKAAYLHILLSTNESFGKTIIEAGMVSKATIASRTLGASTIISNNKNGWLVDINDLEDTIDKINGLLNSSEKVSQAGEQARLDFIEQYGQSKTFVRVKDFWLKIING
jgi:glycosyltransferase involved in cell wall biosynthesis